VPVSFSSTELINTAISIERMGIAFYDIMTKSMENDATRDIFQYLTNMERGHVQVFQGMLNEAHIYQMPESFAQESASYFQVLVDSAVFTDDMITSEMATQADNDIRALELAIYAEKDSILFYYEMKEIMPQRAQALVNKIIIEEKSHLRRLSELKEKLASSQ